MTCLQECGSPRPPANEVTLSCRSAITRTWRASRQLQVGSSGAPPHPQCSDEAVLLATVVYRAMRSWTPGDCLGLPTCCRPASAAAASPFVRMLAEAEVSAGTAEGAAQLWGDSPRLTAVLEMLKRPASGSAYKQWASSAELRKAAKVGWPALPCTVPDQQKLWHHNHCTAAARTCMAELPAHRSCCSPMCSCTGARLPHLALRAAIPPPQLLSHRPIVAQVASLLLQRQDGRREQAAAVMRAVAAAAQAAMAVDPETTAVIAEALRKAEAAAVGQLSRHSAI